jgi:DNA-binding transcriptional MerR regulator
MSRENRYRTVELARMVGCSVQKVRNWEAFGFLPTAKRAANNYRYYTDQHIEAFRVSKLSGFSWMITMEIMRAVHRNDLPGALTLIDAQHAELHAQREHINATLVALRVASIAPPKKRLSDPRDSLTIGAAAKHVGVRVSAVRFWEGQGLLSPGREKYSRYRRYDAEQMRQLQVIVMLRKANYSFDAIRAVLDELASGNADQAIAAAEHRLMDIIRISAQRLRGLALLSSYLERYYSATLEQATK